MNNLIKQIKDESGRVKDFEVIKEETSLNGNYVGKEIKHTIEKYGGLKK
ncbi:MAG: hypothetical protein QT05_C0048G0025 [archaeon GW2011_AR13]|nr:MAG: hypothetical protein QT05_C0048G0025 [archaeon GW2011_AR13]HIG94108.1 hypothetical protein [Nanoarchaeota archaeon]HIH63963.1 hypothetical protein [Nanoarchaeota archaeon]HIJ09695.1 hypothetical protein [Nanoarchaeota archaeon]